jgi:hypothetical protein
MNDRVPLVVSGDPDITIKPLIERMADALEDAKDTIVDLSRATDNEYGAVGFGVRINKLLDEYQASRRANHNHH